MKRSGPIQRKTRLQSHSRPQMRTRLKSGLSTGKPTKDQAKHLASITQPGRCVCCQINVEMGLHRADGEGCDAHHVLSGGRRMGHMATLGRCPWHHRKVRPSWARDDAHAERVLGPSLLSGSKPFKEFYGTDEEQLILQAQRWPE